jgi:hypothetical protein
VQIQRQNSLRLLLKQLTQLKYRKLRLLIVSIFLTSVENLISRRGSDGNSYDAPFPALSSVILNGNWAITRKPEVAKRMHIIRNTEEDRHSREPNTPFNLFQNEHGWKIKIIGDWTIRYIYEHRKELLVSGKYNTYEIARIAIEEFYRSVGKPVPDWLTHFVPDTAQEELDVDEKTVIRSILFEHVNRTLEHNSRLVNIANAIIDSYGKPIYSDKINGISLADRIDLCLNNDLWPWIRINKHNREEYFIDTSVLDLFSNRLPNLDLKKLGQKMQLEYQQKKGGGRILKCTRSKLIKFIVEDEEFENLETGNQEVLTR